MVTSKEEPSVEISSTFDMTNNLDFKKNISNMAKSFLQVSIGYRNRNVVRDFCLNLDIKNCHFNILIQK
jgi:hypothetical protein